MIQPGDAVVLDFGGRLQGYHSDITRTFFVGDPPLRFQEVYAVVRAAPGEPGAGKGRGLTAENVDPAAAGVVGEGPTPPASTSRVTGSASPSMSQAPYVVEGSAEALDPAAWPSLWSRASTCPGSSASASRTSSQ